MDKIIKIRQSVFETNYTTKSGDKIIIFGKYGQDC